MAAPPSWLNGGEAAIGKYGPLTAWVWPSADADFYYCTVIAQDGIAEGTRRPIRKEYIGKLFKAAILFPDELADWTHFDAPESWSYNHCLFNSSEQADWM